MDGWVYRRVGVQTNGVKQISSSPVLCLGLEKMGPSSHHDHDDVNQYSGAEDVLHLESSTFREAEAGTARVRMIKKCD